jgi:hypothetical protein
MAELQDIGGCPRASFAGVTQEMKQQMGQQTPRVWQKNSLISNIYVNQMRG